MLDDQSRQLFQAWFQTELGKSLSELECSEIALEIDNAVGYYLVIQSPLKDIQLDQHRLRESILIVPELELGAPKNIVVAKANELPLESDGVDVHVLHHTLDLSSMPHDVIREAARTLLPSGKLIVIGFNPLSLWGIRRLFSKRVKAPWCGRFIGHKRLEDWLKVAGLTLEKKRFVQYEPPIHCAKWRQRCGWIGRLLNSGKMPFGGIYIMTATKQTRRYIPIKPSWKSARVRVPPFTKPAAKEIK
ncbi:methyltransferase domain-containing protein [Marinomonas sp. TI.3.20]|uniref:class I SAM-dependent methyltransferase n=1 Tax=Marinomonas sp. TI.3.20 TaxID=3121296 RepID=UPI00311DF3F5